MNPEHIKVHIGNALDLIQLITEDVEGNFMGSSVDNAVRARATMTVSALYIVSDYLRNIREEVTV